MFDIGFFELLIIAVVGLVVIGPERLPGAIRSGALWWGRMKRSIRETRSELERQLGADEIRRELHNEEVMRSLEALRHSQKELEREVKEATEAGEIGAIEDASQTADNKEQLTHDSPADQHGAEPNSADSSAQAIADSQPCSEQEPGSTGHKKDA